MLFSKDKGLSYTDICVWIDNNAYRDDVNDNLLFEYLYYLFEMFARNNKYFANYSYIDQYAIFSATNLFYRYKNPKQYELLPDNSYRMKKIKSVLNYVKSVAYGYKIQFQQESFSQVLSKKPDDFLYDVDASYKFNLSDVSGGIPSAEFKCYMHDVIRTIRGFLSKIPYVNDIVTWENIYQSCLLTLLYNISLPENSSVNNNVILYELPKNMYGYIQVLTNKLKRVIAGDLNEILQENLFNKDNIQRMMLRQMEVNNDN